MRTPSHDQLNQLARLDLLRAIRNWFATLDIVAIAIAMAVMTVRNTVANPETWTSAFNALAASGPSLSTRVGLLVSAYCF